MTVSVSEVQPSKQRSVRNSSEGLTGRTLVQRGGKVFISRSLAAKPVCWNHRLQIGHWLPPGGELGSNLQPIRSLAMRVQAPHKS